MPVITFLNQKGGVGKTSSVHHLGGALARSGREVLIVDNDPQASLTQGLYGPEATEHLPPDETLYAVYSGSEPLPESVIRRTRFPRLSLLPGSALVGSWNLPEPDHKPINVQMRLRDFADQIRTRYSVVLIDCPPNLNLCAWAALLASDGVVIPVQAEDYGAQGIPAVLAAVDQARRTNVSLSCDPRVLVTMFDRRIALANMYEGKLRERFGDRVFAATIPRLVDYAEAINARKPVGDYRPRGQAADRMDVVASEMMRWINKFPSVGAKRRAVSK